MKAAGNPAKAAEFAHFFRAGPGGYGEGDRFLVVPVPVQRQIARQFRELPEAEWKKLLRDPHHECRLTALFIMTHQFERGDAATQDGIVDAYLALREHVNNWDLVDASAYKILGAWLVDRKDRGILYDLAQSDHLWSRRIAMVSCFAFIRENDLHDTFAIADLLLEDSHDLIHKAVGWMLREAGKRDEAALLRFLKPRYARMPRTMLRYAIEKFDRSTRTAYLQGEV